VKATALDGTARATEQVRIVVVGHVDHGKSTVIGRLLADAGALPEGKLSQVRELCRRTSRPFEYAFLLDALQSERDQGITIDTARCFFKTADRTYLINDAPGHVEFLKNMVTGAAGADAALLVIDAAEGIQENSKRHGYVVSMLGIPQLAVVVNKLDLVGYKKEVFDAIASQYADFLGRLGIKPVAFIPVSARHGVNVVKRSRRTAWYKGPTVLQQIEHFEKAPSNIEGPFRMPVQDIYRFTGGGDNRRIVAGTIESGVIRPGDEVVFYPSEKRSRVKTIEIFGVPQVQEACAGQAVGFTLTEQIYARPGEVMCRSDQPPPQVGRRFRATVFWLGRAPMIKGRQYKLKLGTAQVPVVLAEVMQVLDASELSSVQGKDQIDRHDVAECILETFRPVAFDRRAEIEATGRFVIVDGYDIAGCGVVLDAVSVGVSVLEEQVRSREYSWDQGLITASARAARFGHFGKFIVFTGQPGSGRTALAKQVEKELFRRGCLTYYLGIGDLLDRLGEGFSGVPDRDAHLRRLGELARILTGAGILFITTLTDVDDFDLEILRKINEPNELFVVNLGENIFSRFPPDLTLPPKPDLKKAVRKITKALESRNVLIEYQI